MNAQRLDIAGAENAGASQAPSETRAGALSPDAARPRIRPLDARGRRARRSRHLALLAAGALLLISLWSAQSLFLLGALLLASLDLIPEIWYRYGLRAVRVQRRVGQQVAALGGTIEVEVSVENRKPLPLPWLEVTDEFPDEMIVLGRILAPSQRIGRAALRLTIALAGFQRLRRRYRLLAVERGVYHFGPTVVRARDPFGIEASEADVETPATLLVQPLVTSIERLNLPSVAPFGEHRSSERLLDDPLRVSGIRDYAPGDEPRRIHWKATARAGALQSKLYDPSTRHAIVIFLDLRVWAGQAATDTQLTELAICAAASVATWAHAQRYPVGLYANAPTALTAPPDGDSHGLPTERLAQSHRLLRLAPSASVRQQEAIRSGLARLLTIQTTPMQALLERERSRLPRGATLVYIGADSALDADLLAALRKMRVSGHPVTLLLTQAEGANDTPLAPGALDQLRTHILGGRALWQSLLGEAVGDDLARQLTHGAKPAFIATQAPAASRET